VIEKLENSVKAQLLNPEKGTMLLVVVLPIKKIKSIILRNPQRSLF